GAMATEQIQHIAIVGSVHGKYREMYRQLSEYEKSTGKEISFVICTGDMQTLRYEADLVYLKVPPKYKQMGDFHLYYEGKEKAPYLTLFIGGNHESSNVLLHLYNGGFVCFNMYYLGVCSCININGLRIVGVSGIYKSFDEKKPYTYPPSPNDVVSLFHTRNYVIQMLSNLSQSSQIDISLSHDWPQGIVMKGNYKQLYRFQPGFKKDGASLGSPINKVILNTLKPKYWISGHMHCEYHAEEGPTHFIALGKIGYKNAISYLDLPLKQKTDLEYDKDWVCNLIMTWPAFSNKAQFPDLSYSISELLSKRTKELDKKIIELWEKYIGLKIIYDSDTFDIQFTSRRFYIEKIYNELNIN
uniref:RNA lariat debranching enzyme, putative n=1 Tax=Entamoeba histolytica TaxID=5759 RepID=UPI0004EF76B9|nr:Chain A, RNA lariat debranching enzyme, putative [Entamoeba histolytica]4PEH_B Chain B, RNA lariat debranching enzyme, putative [Entamoeba histolytica]4PEH_C Chain C, RNA lariat debranching enzyme, putative [Entamoeba histolytica]4PEH_D Chain D, RNA lariat debranching enzyme, putative [Entamoeba histolytica]4PEH_E Chain E, RNA lariat debranching enzyme, putative [Entamoeba histolytica]4PEI_A Chain A, RNA lariat debranching enzyme, putative [Entamoeba histolytica]4PEI_B Chain B, RNA lariat 